MIRRLSRELESARAELEYLERERERLLDQIACMESKLTERQAVTALPSAN